MPSFGRLQAALASATNELTLAAANINFDFTLVRCEVPKEFEPLGSALSQTRKENAEGGTAHITARRLGVLFEGILGPTPALVKSYGIRVSEIAQAVQKENPPEIEESIFAAHAGADGTSIWAAATSSPTALHVQLLACMLARLWSASEATSIWVELIKERRKQIEGLWNDEEPLRFATVAAAAQSDISRASLAEWDASVRSWLRTADRFNQERQDKLMILLDKVNLPISHDTVYSSVIAAWKSAVETMERLVKGMPQAVNEGSCLLALSAWHLYPDITVGGSDTPPLQFSDPLVQSGGFLTLGLARPREGAAHGVFWSLSLAHLNFYGRPVSRKARFDTESRKLSFGQFTQAVYGSLLGHWNLTGPLAQYPSRIFVAMKQTIERQVSADTPKAVVKESRDPSSIINILSRLGAAHLDALPFPDDIIHKLFALGNRRASKFIKSPGPRPFLGIGEVGDLLNKLNGPMERVALLRRLALSSDYYPDAYIIRYFDDDKSPFTPAGETQYCAFASAQARRNSDGLSSTHGQWVPRSFRAKYPYPGEVVTQMTELDSLCLASQGKAITMTATGPAGEAVLQDFHFVCGAEYSAAIYIHETAIGRVPKIGQEFYSAIRPISIEDIEWCLESDFCKPEKLLDIFYVDPAPSNLTLRALAIAHKAYQTLPDAAISTRSLESPLYQAKWAKSLLDIKGGLDPLGNINFHYQPPLACDPSDDVKDYELKRFTGNIGRSGLTLLIPPKTPMIMKLEETSWRVMSSSEFDGKSENYFPKTSMHLSFTEYYVPLVQSGDVQEQDSQVFLLESVVSIYDAGRWIGDVDVLKCLASPLVSYMPEISCRGNHPGYKFVGISSLETWDDVLDPPLGDGIIRAQGSWLARLAIVTIFVEAQEATDGERISVLSSNTCWGCSRPDEYFSLSRFTHGHSLSAICIPSISRFVLC
ncbi:uncharacterized protein FMAN_12946 [Fusarium mangiferae]|uniref:Uncharacterized protein n=1 Tax=Fusarium mangiferae TaxID=192010 RepID=A0A1L7UBP5_FUSMA|nr:uncharacterized protein FMAN_12946 [Fusarium mangiferae]CVL04921.1 uncharacterized protein FMAN_12946 [Fusarium mangiferae]